MKLKNKNLKFRVYSPEHSAALQTKLLEFGFEWPGKRKKEIDIYTKFPYIYTAYNMILNYGTEDKYFNNHPNTEATLDCLYNPENFE